MDILNNTFKNVNKMFIAETEQTYKLYVYERTFRGHGCAANLMRAKSITATLREASRSLLRRSTPARPMRAFCVWGL